MTIVSGISDQFLKDVEATRTLRNLDGVTRFFLKSLDLTYLGDLAYIHGEQRLVVKLVQQLQEISLRYDIIWIAILSKNAKNSLEVQFMRDSAFKFGQLQAELVAWIKVNIIGKADDFVVDESFEELKVSESVAKVAAKIDGKSTYIAKVDERLREVRKQVLRLDASFSVWNCRRAKTDLPDVDVSSTRQRKIMLKWSIIQKMNRRVQLRALKKKD